MKPLTASETRKDERMDFEKMAQDLRREIERIIMTQDGDGVLRVEKACEKALRAAATVPKNMVRVGVEDMTLLGTLPVTKDRCVIGNGTPDLCSEGPHFEPVQVLEVRTIARNVRFIVDDGTRYIPEWKPADCYSTREAAESAARDAIGGG